MATEDFTTYTEVDPGEDLTVIATKITATNAIKNQEWYVTKDKEADHFGDFEHLEKVNTTASDDYGSLGFWGLSNGSNTMGDMFTNNEGLMWMFSHGVPPHIYLQDASNDNYDSFACSYSTDYYCTIKRAVTAGTVKIYSDAERTNLLDTVAITTSELKYRWIYGCISYNSGEIAAQVSGYTENLDLQESPPPPPPSGSDFIPNYFDAQFVS